MQVGGAPRSPMSCSELQAIVHRIYLLSVEVCKYHVQEQYALARQPNCEALLVLQGMQGLAITWTPTLLQWEESTRQTLLSNEAVLARLVVDASGDPSCAV